jgi:uncharacterized coiled-coil DUF342 family protein
LRAEKNTESHKAQEMLSKQKEKLDQLNETLSDKQHELEQLETRLQKLTQQYHQDREVSKLHHLSIQYLNDVLGG